MQQHVVRAKQHNLGLAKYNTRGLPLTRSNPKSNLLMAEPFADLEVAEVPPAESIEAAFMLLKSRHWKIKLPYPKVVSVYHKAPIWVDLSEPGKKNNRKYNFLRAKVLPDESRGWLYKHCLSEAMIVIRPIKQFFDLQCSLTGTECGVRVTAVVPQLLDNDRVIHTQLIGEDHKFVIEQVSDGMGRVSASDTPIVGVYRVDRFKSYARIQCLQRNLCSVFTRIRLFCDAVPGELYSPTLLFKAVCHGPGRPWEGYVTTAVLNLMECRPPYERIPYRGSSTQVMEFDAYEVPDC